MASYATFSAVSGSPVISNSLSTIITDTCDHQLCNGGSFVPDLWNLFIHWVLCSLICNILCCVRITMFLQLTKRT